MNHLKIGRNASTPCVPVRHLFEDRLFFSYVKVAIPNTCRKREIGPRGERRVDINEVDLAGEGFEADRGVGSKERGEDAFVVAPDKLVTPTIGRLNAIAGPSEERIRREGRAC